MIDLSMQQFIFSGVSFKSSNIISGNKLYESKLWGFLVPAVGDDPHWELCYRASTHGFSNRIFHERCDGKRSAVTIVKVGDYVFGGYTDVPWGK